MSYRTLFRGDLEPSLLTSRGYDFLELKDHLDEAQECFQTALLQGERSASILAGLALCLRAKKDFEASISYFKDAVTLAPENAALQLEWCLTPIRQGQFQFIREGLERFFAIVATENSPQFRWVCLSEILITLLKTVGFWKTLSPVSKECSALLGNTQLNGTNARERGMATFFISIIALFEDRWTLVEGNLATGLTPGLGEALDDRLDAISSVLKLSHIGKISVTTMKNFLAKLEKILLELYRDPDFDKEMTRWKIIPLLIQIRSSEMTRMLGEGEIDLARIPPHSLVDLFHFAAPEVAHYFQTNYPSSTSDLFHAICGFCFSAAESNDAAAPMKTDTMFRQRLKELNPNEINTLLFQIHQASFNLISSGHRTHGKKFTFALAEIHCSLFGSADPFFRNAEGYLTIDWFAAFGHLPFLEILLRAERAGFGPKIPRKIACDPNSLAIESFVPFLKDNGFEFIPPPKDHIEPRRWQMDYVYSPETGVSYFMDYFNAAQERLHEDDPEPCLKIPTRWVEEGDGWLKRMGIERTDRICVFHCRESTFWTNIYNAFLNSRNGDVQTYRSSLLHLLERGFTVFRIGDPGMSPIQGLDHPRYFDRTATTGTPPWFDFFLLHRANLFLGTNSGPAGVANVLQTPSLLTNWFPLNVHIPNLGNRNVLVPKLVARNGGFVSLETMLSDPLSSTDVVPRTANQALTELSSDDLLEATEEMIARLEGTFNPELKLLKVEQRIQEVWRQFIPWTVVMPHSFLRKYGDALLCLNPPGIPPEGGARQICE